MAEKHDGEIDPYEREREEARMRVIEESMERAFGRGKLKMNPPKQDNDYSPFEW